MEEPLLVVAQREVVERAGAVAPHNVAGTDLGGASADGGAARDSRRSTTGRVSRYSATDNEAEAHGQQADGGVAVDVGGKATQSTPTRRSAEPRSTSGHPGSG